MLKTADHKYFKDSETTFKHDNKLLFHESRNACI